MRYQVKSRLLVTDGDSVPILKPDSVSLGKCVACREFIGKYASIQNVDVINMLRDGCRFIGFKKMNIESSEEEGFANMHHVLLLETLDGDITKEVCVQRKNCVKIEANNLKHTNEVATDIKSVVIIVQNPEGCIELYYFGKHRMKLHKLNHVGETFFSVNLASDVLYISFENHIDIISFKENISYRKEFEILANRYLLSVSSEKIVFCEICKELGEFTLTFDDLKEGSSPMPIIADQEMIADLLASKILITNIFGTIYWLVAGVNKFAVLMFKSRELILCKSKDLNLYYPDAENFAFERFCFSESTSQAFLLYRKDEGNEASSFILVFDMITMQVISILEMEFTLNRKPTLFMYPSRDGGKLFVEETFDNRVIFYQVFSLLPSGLTLKNILKQFIWKNLSIEEINNSFVPEKLRHELLTGF